MRGFSVQMSGDAMSGDRASVPAVTTSDTTTPPGTFRGTDESGANLAELVSV
jgi:hypothetical protein